jgi:hypothetical protein
VVRGAVVALAIVAAGLLAWTVVQSGFGSLFSGAANVALGDHVFGRGGHATFVSGQPARAGGLDDDASWDTSVRLSIDGVPESQAVRVNPRRLAFLPLLFLTALICAAPLPARRRLICLAAGAGVITIVALASLWIIVAWLFARVPGLVYELSPFQQHTLDFAYEAFVTSIGLKFVIPLLLAAALVLWQRGREEKQPVTATKPSVRRGKRRR